MKHKTYARRIKRLTRLMSYDPKADTSKGSEVLRLAKQCEVYERIHFSINHSKRQVRADILDRRSRKDG